MMHQLTFAQKISYAIGGLALNLANLAISQWLLKLYVPSKDTALVDSTLFAAIFLIGRCVDGVTEPIAGFLSDHHRSRRGRRIPFIMAMAIPTAVVTFLLWTPPFPHEMHWVNAVYVFTLVQLFFIFWSLLANPYMALLPEITTDLQERVNISTLQAVFLMLGTLIFGIMGPIKAARGWIGIGIVTGALTFLSFMPTIFMIKEKSSITSSSSQERLRFTTIFHWTRTTFKNRAFLFLLAANAFLWFSLNMIILLVPFWVQYVLGRTDREVVLLMAPLLGSNIVCFFVFNFLANRYGKYPVYLLTLASSAVTMALLAVVGLFSVGDAMLQSQIAMGFIGLPVAGIMILPPALLSDVIDYDETLTGKRREGIYVGVQAIFQKIAIGISIAVATVLMYTGGTTKPTETGLKMIALTAAISALIACIIFTRYPIREKDGKTYLKD
jgi:GPH family glycoside/pentoside/hexuronide:cation symporter